MTIDGHTIEALLEKRGAYPQWTAQYGEPGYGPAPEHGIIFANWNRIKRRVCDWLEHHGYALEWCDEWTIIGETGKAYRTAPDSYGWKPSYVVTDDGDEIGRDEIEDGTATAQYVDLLLNNPRKADTFNVDWTKHGFAAVNRDYEHGFHPGQTDNPRKILSAAQASGPGFDYLFSIDSVGQFDMRFSLWRRAKDSDSDSA